MKYFVFTTLVAASLSAFAGGPADDSAISDVLDQLNEEGYSCQKVVPEGFSLRSIPSGGSYVAKLKCEKEDSKNRIFEVKYSVTGNPNARCRNQAAVSINEIVSKK